MAVLLWRRSIEQVREQAHTGWVPWLAAAWYLGCMLGLTHPWVSGVQGSWRWLGLVVAWAAMGSLWPSCAPWPSNNVKVGLQSKLRLHPLRASPGGPTGGGLGPREEQNSCLGWIYSICLQIAMEETVPKRHLWPRRFCSKCYRHHIIIRYWSRADI